jgi:predicted nucleic acid-binding protein
MWGKITGTIPEKNCMNDNVFIDTNIWGYVYTDDDEEKRRAAFQLLESLSSRNIIISPQILSEFYSLMNKHKIPHDTIIQKMGKIIDSVNVCGTTLLTIMNCIRLKEKYGYSWWDSLILASSLESNCDAVYSEDMQNGQVIEKSLRIINPLV